MLEQRVYNAQEITEVIRFAHQVDNAQAAIEASDHLKYFGKAVIVIKGRKVPTGTTGTVFWLARKSYSRNQWFGYVTRIGIKDKDGTVYFTSAENVTIAGKEGTR